MSGLPPSSIARLSAQANIQAVAVKLVALPPDLNNNPVPLKLNGTVEGQNPDGSLRVQTERGIVTMLLRDRQNLPQGQRMEIDIPAGRPPQQAAIRHAPESAATAQTQQTQASSTNPSLASQLQQTSLSSAATAAALRLDRTSNVKATEIEDALKAAASKLSELANLKLPAAPLQPGQGLRLIPVPPGQLESLPLQPGQVSALAEGELLEALTNLITKMPAALQAEKTALLQLISRMDLSQLTSAQGQTGKLSQALQNLSQLIDIKTLNDSIRYEPIKLFNPSKPLDVQINALTTQQIGRGAAPLPLTPQTVQVIGVIPPGGTAQTIPQQSAPPPLTVPGSSAPPATTGQGQSPSLPAQVLPAQVLGFTKQGLPLLSLTPPTLGFPQTYVAQFQANNIQPGSTLLLSLLPAGQAAGSLSATAPSTPVPLSLAAWMQPGAWDNLSELVQTVHQLNPALGQAMTQMLPSPQHPQSMGPLALFFLSVMRTGDMENFMPAQALNLLRQSGRNDALRALSSDLTAGARADTTLLPQDWRATLFPVYHDQQVHKMPLYYKQMQDKKDEGKERREKLLRFLFDLKLTRMGNVQIDGFMQPQRLDMIMRTKSPLSPPMQQNMKLLYTKAMEKSNLAGELAFQFKPEQWVTIDIPVTQDDLGVMA